MDTNSSVSHQLFPMAPEERRALLDDWIGWILEVEVSSSMARNPRTPATDNEWLYLCIVAEMSLSMERQLCPVHPIGGALPPPPDSSASLVADLCRRTLPLLTTGQADSLLSRLLAWALMRWRETHGRSACGYLDRLTVDNYIYHRRRASGALLLLELRNVAGNLSTAADLVSTASQAKGRELEIIAADVMGTVSDLITNARKDSASSAPGIATCFEKAVPTSRPDALDRAIAMVRERLALFEHVSVNLAGITCDTGSDVALGVISGLRTIMSGFQGLQLSTISNDHTVAIQLSGAMKGK